MSTGLSTSRRTWATRMSRRSSRRRVGVRVGDRCDVGDLGQLGQQVPRRGLAAARGPPPRRDDDVDRVSRLGREALLQQLLASSSRSRARSSRAVNIAAEGGGQDDRDAQRREPGEVGPAAAAEGGRPAGRAGRPQETTRWSSVTLLRKSDDA
jgi:hypothetical protein